ncbi:MAG: FkbM family methyltransferase [Verrucomicrobiota bacterium]
MTMITSTEQPTLFERTLLFQLWTDFRTRWRFKFTLPRVRTVTLEGVELDVSMLSSLMKNNLLLGRYEVQERMLTQQVLTRDDTVLEIGGAIGFIGLFCQTRLGITRYTTVEANPGTVELLKRNYALNQRVPVVWNMALAAADGEVTLNIGNEFWENSLVAGANSGRSVRVPAASLASLVGRLDYAPTALIVDIEGAEQFVDFRQVPPSVKKVIIELHPHCIGHAKTYQIVADFVNLGFHVEREEGGTFLFLRP